MKSILSSVKLSLGISVEDEYFDEVLIMHINTVFFTLAQLGVGPENGFKITSARDTWDDFVEDMEEVNLEAVKSYMFMKVKLIFDPPTTTALIESMNRLTQEYEARLNYQVDP